MTTTEDLLRQLPEDPGQLPLFAPRPPFLEVDEEAEARVDAWCREHEQPRAGRPIERRKHGG